MVSRLFESVVVILTGSFISIVLTRFLGEVMDKILNALMDAGIYEVSPAWQTDPSNLINLFYIVCMLPAVLSLFLGVMISQRKTETGVQTEYQEFEYEELR
jgi:hypothetical protein